MAMVDGMQHGGMSALPSITNNDDIRYLGRVLGDVIRALGGERLFAATEARLRPGVEGRAVEGGLVADKILWQARGPVIIAAGISDQHGGVRAIGEAARLELREQFSDFRIRGGGVV